MNREAVCAGTWYPTERSEIESYLDLTAPRRKALAVVCPHAGWTYSGRVAGEVYSRVEPASLYILIGPNHRGLGVPVSVYPGGAWKTPLGDLPVDEDVARAIIDSSEFAQADTLAHVSEHSLEVQMPFIKYFSPGARIVPISLADYRPQVCRELGDAIARALGTSPLSSRALLVASTDMSHYVAAEYARKVDHLAIDRIRDVDPDGLISTVRDNDISMCGSGPTVAILGAARQRGATKAELVRYATSGDVTGDFAEVVGYAGLIIS